MLAKTFDPDKHRVGGWWMSEKRDGQRAFWDGGITRGVPKKQVPWANNAKDERYVDEQIATGLWSRYGNVIHAPDHWLDSLPPVCLDGELYLDRGAFQETRKIISTIEPGPGWRDIRFLIIDTPNLGDVLQAGQIRNPQFEKFIDYHSVVSFVEGCGKKVRQLRAYTFSEKQASPTLGLVGVNHTPMDQEQLPINERRAREQM